LDWGTLISRYGWLGVGANAGLVEGRIWGSGLLDVENTDLTKSAGSSIGDVLWAGVLFLLRIEGEATSVAS
jgi:hypothetical protein